MKNFDQDEDIVADINMTPLIDIMLVLLIIFMVTSSVSLESGLDIELPGSSVKSAERGDSSILVSISRDQKIFINGTESTVETYSADLKRIMEEEKSTIVIIEGDKGLSLGQTVEMMDASIKAGATKFAIATDEQTSP
jgi:biopolymer transport protein ExbD